MKLRKRRALGLAQPQAGVKVRGVEIVQCVQDLTNSVPLVADKATIARLYLEPTSVLQPGQITAELAWSRSGGGDTFLPAINSLRLDPGSPFSLHEQREDLDKSLNFRLPAAAISVGQLSLRISRIFQPGGDDLPAAAFNIGPVTFTPRGVFSMYPTRRLAGNLMRDRDDLPSTRFEVRRRTRQLGGGAWASQQLC